MGLGGRYQENFETWTVYQPVIKSFVDGKAESVFDASTPGMQQESYVLGQGSSLRAVRRF
jgi:hypothetical protein